MTDQAGSSGEAGSRGLAIAAISSAAGAAVGYQLGGPGGAAIGAAAAPYLAALIEKSADELQADRTSRAEEMLRAAGDAAGLSPDQFAEQVSRSPRTRFLTAAAIQAAADTFWPPSVRALGRALAEGLVQAEDTAIDIPKMILPAMTQMVAPHLQLLDLMVMCRWDNSMAGRGAQRIDAPATAHLAHIKSEWTARQMKAALTPLEPVLQSVIGTLERHGLIEQNDSTPEALTKFSQAIRDETARKNPPGRKVGLGHIQQQPPVLNPIQAQRVAPPPSWSPTDLGKQVLGYYELAAEAGELISPPPAG
jgi:hypothetical protein